MERDKKIRGVLRSGFTRLFNQFNSTNTAEATDVVEVQVCLGMLEKKFEELRVVDQRIFDLMLEADYTEDELTNEEISVEDYCSKFVRAKILAAKLITEKNDTDSLCNSNRPYPTRKFKLPQIELKKFGGDVKEWLSFWSLFKKIHEDESIVREDKFQYLIQAIIPGTRARELVDSFPPTGDNYVKVIDSLKSRFGRDDLLVEVYVRELLKLVLHNALQPEKKVGLSTLYDKIESHMRALDTLGVTTDKCAAMLYPLVESCIPAELLRAWQRTTSTRTSDGEITTKRRLDDLMTFLRTEVEGEERINIAVSGFGLGSDSRKTSKKKYYVESEENIPSAVGLLNNIVRSKYQSPCPF